MSVGDILTPDYLPAFTTHMVLRGTYLPDTVRCTSGTPFRVPSYVDPDDYEDWAANGYQIMCYVDVRVSDYIVGSGPPRLTAFVWFYSYWVEGDLTSTDAEFIEGLRAFYERFLVEGEPGTKGIVGREVVIFVWPSFNHAVQVWMAPGGYDVQRREDGTVIAVHPDRDLWRSLRPDKYEEHLSVLEPKVSDLEREIVAAHQARVNEYGGRIGADTSLPLLVSDIHSLSTFMASTGAYDHPDGPPAQPPPVPGEGDPVPDIRVDDSTPAAQPTPPGGVESSTPTPTAADVSENRAPSFGSSSYSFSVAEDAATSTSVGTTSATDPDSGDTLSYSITGGNDAGKFAVGPSDGHITVAGALDYETASSYTLTVEASDGNGGAATATVVITVTDVSEGT